MERMGKVLKAWQKILFQDFFSLGTITTKNYETDEMQRPAEERATLEANRFSGYQKIILAGLGTMFWGTATNVIAHLEKKLVSAENLADWVHYSLAHWVSNSFIYGAFALVLMSLGLCASTFPSSSPLAAGMAGLGGWQAFVFTLGTFHMASLKYYSNTEECFYSFLGAFAVITVYWGFAAQDPLLLHIVAKSILWVISLPFFAVFFVLYYLLHLIMWFARDILKLGQCSCSCWSSLRNALSALFHLARGYQPPGQGQQAQP
ncbi:uncharacterized protein [Setaria viridis]|uniref:Uncharacterized protein n=1 Tax=Setaria viridis TaxID=4556 RepID=A0A4U6UCC6_SETVI|nr:uncharacterized protein LOC117855273 [Setaria viridis]TKW13610.1 hypothetical protein SEVIR_5G113400v2 [Setaria viridis]